MHAEVQPGHRKKTKCYFRPPSCADCIRLGVKCTFERLSSTVDTSKRPAKYGPRLHPLTSFWLRSLAEPHTDNMLRPCRKLVSTNDDTSALQAVEAGQRSSYEQNGLSGSDADLLQDTSIGHDTRLQMLETINQYFRSANHTFPIISRKSFDLWMAEGDDEGCEPESASIVLLQSIFYTGLHNIWILNEGADDAQRQAGSQHLRTAMSKVGDLLTSSPSIRSIQALVSFVSCVQRSPNGAEKGLPILAVAVQFAKILGLHRLDQACDITLEGRFERLRLFWCLYILDRETSLRLHVPPLISDEDLFILNLRMIPDDCTGLVKSTVPGEMINVFAARQRLAQISGQIWKELYTFSQEHLPQLKRDEVKDKLNRSLLQWKAEWFDYGDGDELSDYWPSEHLVSMVHLQFDFLYCLLKVDAESFPKVPKDITVQPDGEKYSEHLQRQVQDGTAPWSIPARQTLQLGKLVRKGGLCYLQ